MAPLGAHHHLPGMKEASGETINNNSGARGEHYASSVSAPRQSPL
jgi:hypothetical protein